MRYEFFIVVVLCMGIISLGYFIGYGIDLQYQLDQKYIKLCHDFIGSQKTAISNPDDFCIWYDEMMRTTR